jgi:hypothetical protein
MAAGRRARVLVGALVAGVLLVVPAVAGATPFTVTNTADIGPGSLRDALANATAHSVIAFNAPPVGGRVVISPATPLPTVPAAVSIDGTTEPGGAPIVIDGSNLLAGNGLTFAHPGVQTTGVFDLRDVAIDDFNGDGIDLAAGSFGLVIAGNLIGIKPDGTAAPNATGIVDGGTFDHIQNNVISGNTGDGVFVPPPGSDDTISGNEIGTSIAGAAGLGNGGAGVHIASGTNSPGFGPTVNGANVISANHNGILIDGAGTSGVLVNGNLLGTALDGTTVLGNTGSAVSFGAGAAGNQIGGLTPNTIAYTAGESGVNIGSTINTALENNGFGDLQNFILGPAGPGATALGDGTVRFTLTGDPANASVLLDFYSVAGNAITLGHSGSATTGADGSATTIEPGSAPCAVATPPGGPTSALGCPAAAPGGGSSTTPPHTATLTVSKIAQVIDPSQHHQTECYDEKRGSAAYWCPRRGSNPNPDRELKAGGPKATSVMANGAILWTITIVNNGTEPVGHIAVVDEAPALCPRYQENKPGFSATGDVMPYGIDHRPTGTSLLDPNASETLAPGQVVTITVVCSDLKPGTAGNTATVTQDGLPVGAASAQRITVTPAVTPVVGTASAAQASGTVAGKTGGRAVSAAAGAPKITKVQVAIEAAQTSANKKKRSCRWLSTKGRIVTVVPTIVLSKAPSAACGDSQVWLTAHGTARWRLRYRHKLPPGRYLVFTRALDATGASYDIFSAKLKNERKLTVH